MFDLGSIEYVRVHNRIDLYTEQGFRWVFFFDEDMPEAIYLGVEVLQPTLVDVR